MTPRVTRVRVFVSGRVQGVFFRVEARNRAIELGLSGWVRNLEDGRVEMMVEGDEDSIQQMLSWCRQGPPMAEVEQLETLIEEPAGERGFRIR